MERLDAFRTFKIRRLLKPDMDVIGRYRRQFDFLHHNPLSDEAVSQIMAFGEFWGIFDKDRCVGCTCIFLRETPFFAASSAAWHLRDMWGKIPQNLRICGYMWTENGYDAEKFYRAAAKLWTARREEMGAQTLVYLHTAHIPVPMGSLFAEGFLLESLRGLDNLVPHFIFVKKPEENERPKHQEESCAMSDTKTISKLCEHGYAGCAVDEKNNILFRR